MPTRSLNSPVLKWPDRETVLDAAASWARRLYRIRPAVRKIAVFGSYARGDAGVGSDLDLLVIVADRAADAAPIDASRLPVPADVLCYTETHWRALERDGGRFARMLASEARWFPREDSKE